MTTGQQLADAVASYGRRNADTTLLLPNGTVRLANATFPLVPDNQAVGGRAWAAGILTILGVGVNSSVLDTSMRAGACVRRCATPSPHTRVHQRHAHCSAPQHLRTRGPH